MILLKIFNSKFLHIEARFTDRCFKSLGMEGRVNLILVFS